MTDRVFHFARKTEIDDWLRLGWLPHRSIEGCGHGEWSVLMEWVCSCPMVKPKRSDQQDAA